MANLRIQKKRGKVDTLWKEICRTVIKLNKTRQENLLDTWLSVREGKINGKKGTKLTTVDEQIIKMIDEEIATLKTERDEDYFREVEYVTKFEYLFGDTLLAQASSGHFNRKFTFKENYDRFCELREKLRKIGNEELAIDTLLEDPTTDEVTKKILKARMAEIEKRRPKRVTEDSLRAATKKVQGEDGSR